MTSGEIFRLQRMRLRLGLREVARDSGVSASTLSRFERGGDISWSHLARASRVLKLSLDDLADGVSENKETE
jgi:transcriptional regulator with XRE-family HTH domain